MPAMEDGSRFLSGGEVGFLKNMKLAAKVNHDTITTVKASAGQNSKWIVMLQVVGSNIVLS